jgi:hypothetical protein
MAGVLLAGPIASASVVAMTYGNKFNGALLGVVALALVGGALRLDSHRVRRGGLAAAILGVAMIAFGSLYPHFLESRSMTTYFFAAATGVLPCPTLSLVVGFALLGGGLGSKVWSLLLAAVGLAYGLFGFVRLGVRIDVVLVVGSVGLLVLALRLRTYARPDALERAQRVRTIHARARVQPPIR